MYIHTMHITTQEFFYIYTNDRESIAQHNEWMDTHGHVELTIGSAFNGKERMGDSEKSNEDGM